MASITSGYAPNAGTPYVVRTPCRLRAPDPCRHRRHLGPASSRRREGLPPDRCPAVERSPRAAGGCVCSHRAGRGSAPDQVDHRIAPSGPCGIRTGRHRRSHEGRRQRGHRRHRPGPQFASVWLSANQSAHAQLSEVLASTPGTSDVQLTLDLQPVVDAVQQHLVDNGFSFLRGVRIDVTGQTAMVTVPQSDLAPARDAWTVLHVLAPWLPLVVLVLAVAAIVLAPQRSWMLLAEAVTVLAAAGAVALAASGAHSWYVAHAQQSSGAGCAPSVTPWATRSASGCVTCPSALLPSGSSPSSASGSARSSSDGCTRLRPHRSSRGRQA